MKEEMIHLTLEIWNSRYRTWEVPHLPKEIHQQKQLELSMITLIQEQVEVNW